MAFTWKYAWICALVVTLTSCSSTPKKTNFQPDSLASLGGYSLPSDITSDLVPKLSEKGAPPSRFDIVARNIPARDFFLSLVEGTSANMIIGEGVKGRISIRLKSVTVADTLKAVRDVYGYDFEANQYGYQILPRKLQTKIIRLDYINVRRQGSTSVAVASGRLGSSSSSGSGSGSSSGNDSSGGSGQASGAPAGGAASAQLNTDTKVDFWADLQGTLQMIIGDGPNRRVMVDSQSGIVVVKAMPNEISSVEKFLNKAQLSLRKQVVIEARILEVQLSEGFEAGIKWDTFGAATFTQSGKDVAATLGSIPLRSDDVGGIFSMNFDVPDFTGVIELLQTQGDVQVLSNPRISTVNNQKAVIKVGTDEYFVTNVSSNNQSTAAGTSQTPQIELTPFFSGIALDVTPQIGENNDVTLHVHPSVTEVRKNDIRINISGTDYNFPSALTSIRESDSIIKAKDGQVVVIGGLIQNKTDETFAKVPFLSAIPLIGKLFTQEREVVEKSELVILLQPRVIEGSDWSDEYENAKERFPNWPSVF